jgi:hypothetical protein
MRNDIGQFCMHQGVQTNTACVIGRNNERYDMCQIADIQYDRFASSDHYHIVNTPCRNKLEKVSHGTHNLTHIDTI